MDINKKGGRNIAPTPNNTPSASAPISQQPKGKGNQEVKITPSLAGAITDKLASMSAEEMEGSFIDTLPKEVQRRVYALQNLQSKQLELEVQFREEVLALEAKYLGLYKPLYSKRTEIVNGKVEPSDEECKNPDTPLEEQLEEKLNVGNKGKEGSKGKKGKQNKGAETQPSIKGVPEFWKTVLLNHPMFASIIVEHDDPLLSLLVDIRLLFTPDNHGFIIEFEFAENEYFTNKVLTKTYYLENSPDEGYDDLVYSKSEGCTIDWKQGKNLTVRVETKKQRHKGTKKTRVVKKLVPQDSFFNFFKTPTIPNEEEEEEDEEEEGNDAEEALDRDFEMGEILKTKIIPRAIDWFTGKALEYDDFFDEYDEEEGDEDDDDLIDDEEEDDDEEPAGGAGGKSEKPAECNQQ